MNVYLLALSDSIRHRINGKFNTERLPRIDIVNIGAVIVRKLLAHRCPEVSPRLFVLRRLAFPLVTFGKALELLRDGGSWVVGEVMVIRKETSDMCCLLLQRAVVKQNV